MPGVQPYVEAIYATAKQKYNYDPKNNIDTGASQNATIERANYKNEGAVILTGIKINI